MNLKQIKYMLVLAQKGSFSDAAEELGISQPSLSQYIKKIENQLGVSLIDRSIGEFRLTDSGKAYVEVGRRMVDLQRQLENQLTDIQTFKSGNLHVGISPHRSVYLMPEILSSFHKKYPGIRVLLDERVGRELMDGAEHGEFDLFVTTLPVEEKLFSFDHLMKEEIVLAVPESMEICRSIEQTAVSGIKAYPAVDLRMMEGQDFIILGDTQLMQMNFRKLCEELSISVRNAVECRSIEAQLSMVKAGVGAALLPSTVAHFTHSETIHFYSLLQDAPHREVVVSWRKEQYLSQAVMDFKQTMIDVCAQIGERE